MLVIQRPQVEAIGQAENNRQKFAIGPLEPGLGHTIGNSLRRMLLSSIPGAAITTVKFEQALHEFDTIDGVSEDVTEIILNIKDVVVTSELDEPTMITLDVKGPKDVTAADIPCPAGIEVVNPSQPIATLSAKGRLNVSLTIERGEQLAVHRIEWQPAPGVRVGVSEARTWFTAAIHARGSVAPPHASGATIVSPE